MNRKRTRTRKKSRVRSSSRKSQQADRAAGSKTRTPGFRRRSRSSPGEARTPDGTGTGWLSVHPRGFGFVTMEDGGEDVFIPAGRLATALHGDQVRVRIGRSERGRDGRVLEVLARGTHRLVGQLVRHRKQFTIEPEDPRLPRPVEVVGALPLGVRAGQEVIAAIERHPIHPRELIRARVLSAIAPRGAAASEIERIKIREGVPEEFPASVLREARSFGQRIPRKEMTRRDDLRQLEFVTIDPEDARDHDDAVYAEHLPKGGFRVWIAIADVSHYVQPGSELDRAALARGTSIYLPTHVVPMLPFELSSHLASLVPGEARLALVVEIDLGPRGAVRRSRYREAVITSKARLTYAGAAAALGLIAGEPVPPEAESRIDLLETLFEAADQVRKRRRRRGALEFELPEPKIELGEDGEPTRIQRARSNPGLKRAYAMIEDLMLLANETVASDLARRATPTIYRIHPAPTSERIERFAELAHSLGFDLGPDAREDPRKLAELLRDAEDSESAPALNYLLLRSMQQATYSTENLGHFALAATHYLHFTSPIRRYPDLAVHRVVRSVLLQEHFDAAERAKELRRQAANSSRLERRAQNIDREIARLYAALFLRDRVGEEFDGRISSVDTHGLWVELDDPFVEAYCPIESLGRHGYRLDALGLALEARRSRHRLVLGQRVRVTLEEVSIESRQLQVRIESGAAAESGHAPEDATPDRANTDPRRSRPRKASASPRKSKSKARSNPRSKASAKPRSKASAKRETDAKPKAKAGRSRGRGRRSKR